MSLIPPLALGVSYENFKDRIGKLFLCFFFDFLVVSLRLGSYYPSGIILPTLHTTILDSGEKLFKLKETKSNKRSD